VLADWSDAPAIILSCPGPLRRHTASLMPLSEVKWPQILLGAESQLLVFAASGQAGAPLFFAPMPEIFAPTGGIAAAHSFAAGAVHLRFGGIRAARVIKGLRNAVVIAAQAAPPPLTASHHPFASGHILPAATQRVFTFGQKIMPLQGFGGATLPISILPEPCRPHSLPAAGAAEGGFDLVSLAEFQPEAWAAGPVLSAAGRDALAATPPLGAICLPWNLDHPGSIIPPLLERLARLRSRDARMPHIVLLPFNYVGQTGIIRHSIAKLALAAADRDLTLATIFLARISAMTCIPALRRLAPLAWIDGNDPEHWWTRARLAACDIPSILLDPTQDGPAPRVCARDSLWIEAQTRCGDLAFAASLPSLRNLQALLRETENLMPRPDARSPRKPRARLRRGAA
jgi:hypothetical protein